MSTPALYAMRWYPLTTKSVFGRPDVGSLVALRHAVWRVTNVTDRDAGGYRVYVTHVGGVVPDRIGVDGTARHTVPADTFAAWHVYSSDRWPMCSCCGEPMPCRAELQDRAVATAAAEVEQMTSRLPGCCWACGYPITSRQQAVAYPGDNVDLPGGPPVRFHTRRRCWPAATGYELRWIAADPRNERILTWPPCHGSLIVHADGTSECHGGVDGCRGHSTHDHQSMAACYCYSRSYVCPRGCDPGQHRGCAPSPRPARRDQPSATGVEVCS